MSWIFKEVGADSNGSSINYLATEFVTSLNLILKIAALIQLPFKFNNPGNVLTSDP